ncbi:hypothetical protein ALC56_10678, partial [Trachymyrmex septentrionalis]
LSNVMLPYIAETFPSIPYVISKTTQEYIERKLFKIGWPHNTTLWIMRKFWILRDIITNELISEMLYINRQRF